MLNEIIDQDVCFIAKSNLNWEKLKNSTILITGANGFLPAYIVHTLLKRNELFGDGIHIIALCRNIERSKIKFAEYLHRPDFELVISDVCTPFKTNKNVDYIIHAASQASPKYYGIDPVGTLNANVIGTNNLLELAKDKNCKGFLYFSSADVYGKTLKSERLSEVDYGYVDPMLVRSCYSESKRLAETMCISWSHQYDLNVYIVRPFHTYGPGMALNDGRVFADFVSNIVRNEDIIMQSDGSSIRSFTYLADATIAYLMVLLNGESGQAYNIANENNELSIKQLAEILAGLFPEKNTNIVTLIEDRGNDYLQSKIDKIVGDTKKIRTLGWEPKFDAAEGFKRTVLSFLL